MASRPERQKGALRPTEKNGLLWMLKEQWDLTQQFLAEHKVISAPVDTAKFFTTQFLK